MVLPMMACSSASQARVVSAVAVPWLAPESASPALSWPALSGFSSRPALPVPALLPPTLLRW